MIAENMLSDLIQGPVLVFVKIMRQAN